ncbi:hypothetical protein F4804DRAFT_49887 [Jackrogersella minutella]|nr:hypothetical protein F4804DRAFT_49887 [Jackrogersella minutella]
MMKSIITVTALLLSAATALPFTTLNPHYPRAIAPRAACLTVAPNKPTIDTDTGDAGIQLTNGDNSTQSFFVYDNGCDSIPSKYVSVGAGATQFVGLPKLFQGRIVRGTEAVNLNGSPHLLGTWLEVGLDASGMGWADVSLIRGCDGAVSIAATDGTNASTGFDDSSVLADAPASVLQAKDSGNKAIMATEDATVTVLSTVANYLSGKLGYTVAYIDDYHGNPVIASSNSRFAVTFYHGAP